MAKKTKAFKDLLNLEQRRQHRQATSDALAQRFAKGSLGSKTSKVVVEPAGQVKMSEVMEDFVAPFLDLASTSEARKKLFAIAIFGWNLALMPESKRQQEVEKAVASICAGISDHQLIEDTRLILNDFIEHKLAEFPDYKRLILDFELREDRRGKMYISVMSTPDPDASGTETLQPLPNS